jgi:uncharacterized iron-regulated membrane protein
MNYAAHSGPSIGVATAPTTATTANRRWRSLWRLHFYAGMFAMPFVVLMASTGLVILYTQPLHSLLSGDRYDVARSATTVPYEVQAAAAQAKFPSATLTGVVTPRNATSASVFSVTDGSAAGEQVFVNPHTGVVLGTEKPGAGIIGLANRLHGYLNLNSAKVSLPAVAAIFDGGNVLRPYVIGDLILEVLGVWTLVLVMSGLYLWWPRRSSSAAEPKRSTRSTRRRFGVRRGTTGRARWRDLHGTSGLLLLGAILVTVVSGLAWSTYWGPNFSALANKVSPNAWTDAPASALGTRGDLDVLGNQIPWNTGSRPIPASYATASDGSKPLPLPLDDVAALATEQGLKPGFKISFPKNAVDETTATTTYGAFTASNSWPRKTNEAHDLYLDQFSGKKLAHVTGYGYGAVSYGLDALVSTHMGTQLGIVSRVMMTSLCVLSLWSVLSALIMYSKRRRPGTMGLPRRPVDVKLSRRIGVTAAVMAVVFPVWGVCAAAILGLDRFVIRRNQRLRASFGQR